MAALEIRMPDTIQANTRLAASADTLRTALALHAAGDLSGAEQGYRTLMATGMRECDALYYLGIVAYQTGHADQAEQIFHACLKMLRFTPCFEAELAAMLKAQGVAVEDDVRGYLRRNRFEPHIFAGTLGQTLDFKTLEPWYFSRRAQPFPREMADFDDLPRLVERYVLKGWLPATKPFRKDSSLLTLGSCFAEELRKYLAENGHQSQLIFVPPGLNNTFALRQFIEWSLTGETSTSAYWYDEHESGGAIKWTPEAEQRAYRETFARADGFVLTVGLAEVWIDKATGGVFWRGVPKSQFDENRHECRISSVSENEENLAAIVALLRRHCGDKPIVTTLSPVPLKATFQDVSCITADCVSKSILRVAIDGLMQRKLPGVHYWPSFEIVKWLGCHLPVAMYGDDGNTRHVSRRTVALILDRFIANYFDA
ncbi:MAG: GSCFA domain-containing protein [Alphaproteobacteria bacterium]